MKKVLLSTSAIALAGALSTANAAEWEMNLGGYMEQHVGYTTSDTAAGVDFDGLHTFSDQEFYVRPSITLDNGIRISARMDFEGADTSGTDEPLMIISGSFGSLTLGEDDHASADVVVAAPNSNFLGINSGSEVNFLPGGAGLVPQDSFSRGTYLNMTGDDMVIKYFTPRFSGFQIGASYARDGGPSSVKGVTNIEAAATANNIFAVGANYSGSFGDVTVSAGAGYQSYSIAAGSNPQGFVVGAKVGVAGFSIGGSFAEGNDTGDDGRSYDMGIGYATGPWSFSLNYLHGESSDGAGAWDEVDQASLSAKYTIAKGVAVSAYGIWSSQDDASTVAAWDGATAGDYDTFVIGTGIRVDF